MSIMTCNRAVQPRTTGTDDTAADQMSGDTIRASHSPSPHTGLEEVFPSQGNITGDREDGPSGLPSNESSEEDVQIDNQPQNLKKYQMYFKRRVIILTLGVYNLNVQKIFECLQTF